MSASSSTAAKRGRAEPSSARPTSETSSDRLYDHGSELARALNAEWRRGRRLSAEQFLAEHADETTDTAATVRLICEEIWLREDAGETVDSSELIQRFPHLRTELELLLACYNLFQNDAPIEFPAAGEELGEFRLLGELGRGATGRVYLAVQPNLCDRPVVVKLTSLDVAEHLSLSRLQHTGIVPLYLVQDFPERGLRALCMPYLGGASLDAVLKTLRDCPVERRSGKQLVAALAELQRSAPSPQRFEGPALRLLAEESYEQAVCWIGACLAEALQYAHERGLLHLDLKPSNILLAGDGQPMLLDFHLSREPVAVDAPASDWLGGTRGYMSPEQAAAVGAIRAGVRVASAVDVRSDIYSLGRLLYEMLGGPAGSSDAPLPPVSRFNRRVPRSLEDLLTKCLAHEPRDRYPTAAALADDLRRHLGDLPLAGVPNRNLRERWHKWRRRKPHALRRLAIVTMLAAACSGSAWYALRGSTAAALTALENAEALVSRGDYSAAVERLREGLEGLKYVPGQAGLKASLNARLGDAKQLRLAGDLRELVDRLRFDESGAPGAAEMHEIDLGCRDLWQARERLLAQFQQTASADDVRTQLLDLAILWASLKVRSTPESQRLAARREALDLLNEAETSLGSNFVLQQERRTYQAEIAGQAAEMPPVAKAPGSQTVWEHYALGRCLLRADDLAGADEEFQQALAAAPGAFWPNYYAGLCAYRRGHYQQALNAFYACVALAPKSAECFYNRGLAHAALEQPEAALEDYSRALQLKPSLARAALNRGQLHRQLSMAPQAAADFAAALAHGADPADVYYQRALLHHLQHDRSAAAADLHKALKYRPGDRDCLSLLKRLEQDR